MPRDPWYSTVQGTVVATIALGCLCLLFSKHETKQPLQLVGLACASCTNLTRLLFLELRHYGSVLLLQCQQRPHFPITYGVIHCFLSVL